jgi:hypothetical protein
MFPASEHKAPFGMRTAMLGMCSNESGIESSKTFMVWDPPRESSDATPK